MDKVSSLKKIAGSNASGETVCEILESMSGMGDKVSTMLSNSKEIILASSTPDSTKRFKITVVDNGTISATEITST